MHFLNNECDKSIFKGCGNFVDKVIVEEIREMIILQNHNAL